MFRHFMHSLVFVSALALTWPALGQSPAIPLGDAFRSMFNPGSNVQRMGSIQRTNYFDDLLNARGRLELAFVIDGTESMGKELSGIQMQLGALVGDLRRVVGQGLAVQMIIYRDAGAASGPISWPLEVSPNSWAMKDVDIATGLSKLVPESGAPYYYEQVDVGLYTALKELSWSSDENVTRWIFLIGDAPPFQAGFAEEANQAVRKYDSEQLKRLAKEKGINVYGIVCPSRPEDAAIHKQVLPECRAFFQELADATGGAVLDLADPHQLSEVQHAAQLATARAVKFAPITQADLDRFSVAAKKPTAPVVVAVVPFLTIDEMNFDFKESMVQLAEEVRVQLNDRGIQTRRLAKVRDEYQQLVRSRVPIDDNILAQKLADRLKVDYLIWRHLPSTNQSSVTAASPFQVAVINARTGKPDAVSDPIDPKKPTAPGGPPNVKLCSQVLQSLAAKTKGNSPTIAKVFDGKFTTRLVATTEEGSRELETARLKLQQSMPKSANLGDDQELQAVIDALTNVPDSMKSDPLLNNLLANAYYGVGLQGKLQSNKAAATKLAQARKHAEIANKGNLEFQADYSFFHEQYDKAIAKYEEIVAQSIGVDAVCRAHWMLVFLYAGDWGVNPQQVNLPKSREHAIALLATYPDSAEAAALKDVLRWDPRSQRTRFNELQLEDISPSNK